MAKLIKATDFLSLSKDIKLTHRVLLLSGDDDVLKTLVLEDFGRATGLYPDSLEKTTVDDGHQLAGLWEEGSLFGDRYLIITVDEQSKFSKLEYLERSLKFNQNDHDRMVILVGVKKPWDGSSFSTVKDFLTEVDCKSLKQKKDKIKLIQVRSKFRGLTLSEDLEKMIAERTETSVDIENVITTLYLVRGSYEVRSKDVEQATKEPPERRDITRALLIGNIPRLTKEIEEGDPIPVLAAMHETLLKLYTYLACKDDNELEVLSLLEIQKYYLKDWKAAKQNYAPQTVRELLIIVNACYQDARIGRDFLWKDRLSQSLRSLL